MADYYQLDVYKFSYKLLVQIFTHTNNLNKEYKYAIGEDIKKRAFEILLNIYRANRNKNKLPLLDKAKDDIEYIRLSIRLLRDLKVLNIKKFGILNLEIENISKQLAGWYKYENNKI